MACPSAALPVKTLLMIDRSGTRMLGKSPDWKREPHIWTDLGGAQDLFEPFLKAEVALCDVSPLSALQVNQLAKKRGLKRAAEPGKSQGTFSFGA